ncbi:PP2C family protein-serine/threonine phosphatase [Verrucosispora sp. FIM060022]|uniref:PP2C family protein-serine/threonine phosphatase n=1 Tax=Verrucosispora sp. FIM060022 TaxID=1479020 RepID=UPI0018F5283D|nr:PP2C family protein-serine/threonine phosphatase [Verrucosispora sp. FIM060022]
MTSTREGRVAGPGRSKGPGRSARPGVAARVDLAGELLDGLTDAVLSTDDHGSIELINAAAARLLPELRPGADLATCAVPALAAATVAGHTRFEDEHHHRQLHGVRRALAGGRSVWYVRDVTEERARSEALLSERGRTAFLADAGRRLGLALHRDQALRAAATLPVPYLADLALVVHLPAVPAEQRPHWVRHAEHQSGPVAGTADWSLTTALPEIEEALDGGFPPPRVWSAGQLDPIVAADVEPGATLLVSPMPGAGRTAGALVLLRHARQGGFDPRGIDLAREFAARAGAALTMAELYDEQAHLARVLQNSLLPPELPGIVGMDVAGGYRAAGDSLRIGGDFYDVLPTDGGALFALGDVCGKGVGAAVLTGRVRQSLQTLRLVEQRPLALLRLLNQALLDMSDAARRSQFTTLLLGTLRREPEGGLRIRVAGGGHPAPLVVDADGTVTSVRVGGMPVGALPDARFTDVDLRLPPGSVLFAHTDGVTEARGGPHGAEMFGERRLRQALSSGAGLPPAALVDRVLRLVDEWSAGQRHDDIAMLTVTPAG